MSVVRRFAIAVLVALVASTTWSACSRESTPAAPTAADATKFLTDVNAAMLKLGTEAGQASWVYSTYITQDTETLNARANQMLIDAVARYAKEAARFDKVTLPPDQRRQMDLLKLSLELVTPANPAQSEELTRIASGLEATYGKGKWCTDPAKPDSCLDIEQITEILA